MDDENVNLKHNEELKSKVNEELKKSLDYYRQTLLFMGANVPIEALCLPKVIENALLANGSLRVYDLINVDLAKIKACC